MNTPPVPDELVGPNVVLKMAKFFLLLRGALHLQSCTQEIFEELVCDFSYSNSLDNCQMCQATKDHSSRDGSLWSERQTLIFLAVHGVEADYIASTWWEKELTLSLDDACMMLMLKEGTMENFIQSLIDTTQTSQPFSAYTRCSFQPNSTLSPILGTWPDQKLQDIWQSLHCAHFEWHDWEKCPLLLLKQELLEPTEAESEGKGDCKLGRLSVMGFMGYGICPVFGKAHEKLAPVLAPWLLPAAEPEKRPPMELEATPALCQPSPQVSESASPPSAVPELEQVLSSSELFKRVLLQQCLGSVWTKQNKPGNEHLAPTVWATVAQFNELLLPVCHPHDSAECLNSSPEEDIAERFQSFQNFKELCAEDNPQGRKLLIKEWPSNKFASLVMDLQRAWKRVQKGVVPYLGTFLTDLMMLDTAMEDYLEENEINHQKKNEYKAMTEIMLLQEAAKNYNLEPKDPFRAWFQLSEDERIMVHILDQRKPTLSLLAQLSTNSFEMDSKEGKDKANWGKEEQEEEIPMTHCKPSARHSTSLSRRPQH
ncbi:hypothetical protein GH733_009912 [Mirounga leonina]|nr:hypothetical protein GH733_009912 [Mirounga leonina]